MRCDTQGICSICKFGYTLNTNKRCIPCLGCQTCEPSDPAKCTSCFAPLVLSEETRSCNSVSCPATCARCNIAGRCLQCIKGYNVTQDGSCTKCIDGCNECSRSLLGCSACSEGMVLSSDSCLPCTVGCQTCLETDLASCIGYVDGYYPLKDANGNSRCWQCMRNCSKCSSSDTCSLCK